VGNLDFWRCDTDTVTVLLGNGDGTFNVTASSPAAGSKPNQLAVGDFNGDSNLDLAITDTYDDTISILLGKGVGRLPQQLACIAEAMVRPLR
jgi:hypothetical protein